MSVMFTEKIKNILDCQISCDFATNLVNLFRKFFSNLKSKKGYEKKLEAIKKYVLPQN